MAIISTRDVLTADDGASSTVNHSPQVDHNTLLDDALQSLQLARAPAAKVGDAADALLDSALQALEEKDRCSGDLD